MRDNTGPWAAAIPTPSSSEVDNLPLDSAESPPFDASLRAFLELDLRPTFVVDSHRASAGVSLAVAYLNPAMRRHNLHERISFDDSFWRWVTVDSTRTTDQTPTHSHRGLHWTKTPVGPRYTVIAACELVPETDGAPAVDKTLITRITSEQRQGGLTAPDFRALLPKSDFVDFFLNFDWASTILGPIEVWSVYFQASVRLMLYDPRPVSLMLANGLLVYNEAYIPIVGSRHPSKYAKDFNELFPEPDLKDFPLVVRKVITSAESMHNDNTDFTLTRHGFNEEAYFSFTLVPIFDANGNAFAAYNPSFETTAVQVAERRMALLTRMAVSTAGSRDTRDFWNSALEVLRSDPKDLFFSSVYAPIAEESSSSTSSRNKKTLKLIGSCNLPIGHPATVDEIQIDAATGIAPYLRLASIENRIIALHSQNGGDIDELLAGVESHPGERCCTLIVLPVKAIEADEIAGFVLCGINRRRPWDDSFATFLQVLSKMMSASMAAAVLVEDELQRARIAAELAAKEQQKLAEELALEMKRASALNMRFTEFAAKAPISIFILDHEGRIVYANELWRRLSGYTTTDDTPMGWLSTFDMTQVKDVDNIWHRLTVEHQTVSYETRLLHGTTEVGEPSWVLCQAFPEINHKGELENIIGCFTDITATKQAELLQQKRTEDALAAKKLQEAFVDITSHELRNPMAVVLMCCEQIINSLGIDGNVDVPQQLAALEDDALSSSLDAAKTIMHCVTHQRRIVDDILTLSKLDSDLLPVAPVRTNVLDSVHSVLSMFTAELRAANITFDLVITDAFKQLNIKDVYVDPSRLAQVFINLLTNAIKFTQTESIKKITVQVAASLERPTESATGVKYISPGVNASQNDITANRDWGGGAPVYLMFAVTDTGRGLSPSEKDILFRRFSQASPRTHVQYGGSGLGLYISRELTEKQGGQIGVSSTAGVGSTFCFYVKSRRAEETITGQHADEPAMADLQIRAHSNGGAGLKELDNKDIPILLVEDNLVNRMVLKRALTRLGFPVLEAGHGQEALEMIQESKHWAGNEETGLDIALICLDNEMPIMDGMTCIRRIRELETEGLITTHLSTIGVTANARKEQIDTFIEAGVDDVVSKPFKTADLVRQIRLWANRKTA